MARTIRNAKLDTRSARSRLAIRRKPYYHSIEPGRHLGYYKGATGGSWLARTGEQGRYIQKALGTADDARDANGIDVLAFGQAQAAARAWFDQLATEADAKGSGAAVTVRTAVESYIKSRDAREASQQGRTVKSSAGHKLPLHVLSNDDLADTELHKLTVAALRKWRAGLTVTAASRQRITNDFKAALNAAAPSAAVRLIIKEGLAASGDNRPAGDDAKIDNKLLSDDELRRLLNAIHSTGDDDLYRLCLLMAATGARFAQVCRLMVKDVQQEHRRVTMPPSRKGRGNNRKRATNIPVGQDVIDALLPVIKGRKAEDPLLERWRHVQTGPGEWKRDRRGPWQSAAEMARPIRTAVKAAGLPASVSAYSFRHSSIVRALEKGLPARLVAQVHDTSVAMIERNYTRFMADALDDVLRTAIVPMVTEDHGDNVVSIAGSRGAA